MLRRLTVRNLAVVEMAEAKFAPGLNVLTGETGAGKSVLMGALELVLGGRADASLVREGAKEAEVEADFDGRVFRRTITAQGRSRAWIDDESLSLAELKEAGARLVDVHGPTANQRLLEESFQRETLDRFGKVDGSAYGRAWRLLRGLLAQEAELMSVGGEDEADMLRFQVNELESAALSDEDDTLASRHAAAAHAEEIVEGANEITEALGGDHGAAERLTCLQPRFASLARHFPTAMAWAREAEEIIVRLQELSRAVADAASGLDFGEEDLAALDARLTLVNRLLRKYRAADVAALRLILEEKRAKLELLEHREERLASLRGEIAAAEAAVRKEGAALTSRRRKAAVKLSAVITEELQGLGFLQARLTTSLESADPAAHGCDRVIWLFEPNPGEIARPLADIASSGEIARVMLAVKVVTIGCENDAPATLVFDEIDANIGGEVGRVVGEKLRQAAQGRQVIAITHLPQSAAFGEHHWVVSKTTSGGRTRTMISKVEGPSRVAEIARMLGGEKLTTVVKRHAAELLSLSR